MTNGGDDLERTFVSECRYNQDVHSMKLHYHNAFEIIYIEKGEIEFLVGEHLYHAADQTLIFISNFEDHSIRILSQEYRRYYILIEPQSLDRLSFDPRLMSIFKSRPADFNHCVDVSAFSPLVEKLFGAIFQECQTGGPYSAELLSSYMQILLVEVFRRFPENFVRPARRINPLMYTIQSYIDQNYTQDISVRQLADEHYLSVHYLSHNFKELTGYSPQQYILLNRLAHAKELLIHTDDPVGHVAFKSGFKDVNNFIRILRRTRGSHPTNTARDRKSVV